MRLLPAGFAKTRYSAYISVYQKYKVMCISSSTQLYIRHLGRRLPAACGGNAASLHEHW